MDAIVTPQQGKALSAGAPERVGADPPARRAVLYGVAIFAASLLLFLWGIDHYRALVFDENWWVPTARTWLQTGEITHEEHPPLGKLLIAAGMALSGDNPFGWRVSAALFGSLTLVAVFVWAMALFRNLAAALWVAAATLFDQVVYIQARIAMLDIFLIAFCTLALAFFTLSFKETRPGRSFAWALAMGVSLGLAGACKWSGFFLLFGIAGAYLAIAILRGWGARLRDPREGDFYGDNAWTRMSAPRAFVALVLAPLAAYVATYAPQMIHAGSVWEFVVSHQKMHAIMSGNPGTHPYSSLWRQWPLSIRPVWYLFQVEGADAAKWSGDNPAQAIVGLANPILLAIGEIGACVVLARWLRSRDSTAMIIAVGFFAQWLPWLVNPKGLEFSFYYFPSVVCLGPATGMLLFDRATNRPGWIAWAALALIGVTFVFFLPVLSAQFGVSPAGFAARMWLDAWR